MISISKNKVGLGVTWALNVSAEGTLGLTLVTTLTWWLNLSTQWPSLTFCGVFGEAWPLAVPDRESRKKKNHHQSTLVWKSAGLFFICAAPSHISLLISFPRKSVTQPLSSEDRMLSWSYHKVLTAHFYGPPHRQTLRKENSSSDLRSEECLHISG